MKQNKKLTKAQLIEKLKECARSDDTESAHLQADAALIEFINDEEIAAAYGEVSKWYA